MRVAFFVVPHLGGIFTLFAQLRATLAASSIDLSWIGPVHPDTLAAQPTWRDELPRGVAITPRPEADAHLQAMEMHGAIENGGFDGVIVNVLADRVATNLVRYLPAHLLRIMVVHNITPGTYAAARAIRGHIHATVGVSERCRRDLVDRHGFARDRTIAIPNAVDLAFADGAAPAPRPADRFRALYLGRIDEAAKGVMWLPRILGELPEDVSLTIAGDGPDLGRLRRALGPEHRRVTFLGAVAPARIARLLSEHDVLIMPSRFEGFGFVIVEAMAMGCVPVASRIRGVTDMVVEHGRDGLLFPVGDWRAAARLVRSLHRDRDRHEELAVAARQKAHTAFGRERMGAAYARLLTRVAANPPPIEPPLDLRDWRMPAGLGAGLRTYIPGPVKNLLRTMRERA